ncbi:uncharacterized protein LOC144924633 isoform X2 [Branchiostoma floridae x Branchiostoma belcheri]
MSERCELHHCACWVSVTMVTDWTACSSSGVHLLLAQCLHVRKMRVAPLRMLGIRYHGDGLDCLLVFRAPRSVRREQQFRFLCYRAPSTEQVQETTMRTPTLVVAIILAMAMAGDSANIERLLHQLRLLAGEETMDDAPMTHTKGKTVDTEETKLLDLVKKLSLESKELEPIDGDVNGEGDTGVDPNYEMAETQDQDPTLKDFSGEKVPDVEENYDMAGLGDQNPTSEEGEAEGDEVTEQNYDQSETGEESLTTIGAEEGGTAVEQNYDVAETGEKDSALKEVGGEQAPDVGQNYGMTGPGDQDPTSKDIGGAGPDVEQNYDMAGLRDQDLTSEDGDVNGEGDTDVDPNYEMAETQDQDPTLKEVGDEKGPDVEQNYDMAGLGDQDLTSEGTQTKYGSSTDGHIENKKAVPAFLAAAAKEIGGKVVSKLGDRIADGVVENHQEKVVSGLQNYLGKQMDKFDDEYKELLKDTSGLAAGLNRPVEEADIQLVPRPGATMGNMYAPPGWEIRHKYKYKEDRDEERVSSGGQASAYTYPAGLGPVLMNGCFGTGYKNGDPCYKAKIPQEGCPNLIDGATYLGVGFDGRGVYSAESRKKSVIQRSCKNLQTYGKNEVPDSMTVQGIYDTDVESYTFSSTEEYRKYLAEKSAVTSASAMFQEEINKASGHVAVGGAFGLLWSAGGGGSSQSGSSRQSSRFSASSSASAQLSEKQTQTFMAMLEINIFRYEIFMDDVTPEQLNVGFLRDFISLPESYFSPGAEIIFQNFYLRWGTHYIKSAKFGGQLKIIKTKQATQDLSMSEFATKAEADWKMTLSTFSAQASQTKSSSWWHEHESKTESKQSSGQAASNSQSQANRQEEKQASAQEYSNEALVVQGGDQKIAAAITEMYTTALTTELRDWLESINDYPKPFSFVLRLVSDLLNIPFVSLFPAGDVDYGCFGRDLKTEVGTDRKYYTQNTTKPDVGNNRSKNGSQPVTVTEIRYCNFENRKALEDSMTKRRLALQRAVTVYLEEGRLLSSDFLLPAGEAGCETAMLAFLQEDNTGVPTWEDMTGGKEFTVVFDMPYDIQGILRAQDVLTLKFYRHKWFSTRKGSVPHLYDGYKNGGSNDVQAKKISVQGLVMTYDEGTGVFTVTDDDFTASATLLTDLPGWVKGRDVARAEYKQLLNHLSQKSDTVGDVPCSIQWTNAHRFDPTDKGKCILFTAASEGDIFVVFASIPQNHETWIYVQITPEGVALYKALRLQTTQPNDNAGGLGSATLYQSYFVCVTEDVDETTTVVQYGKTPDNEERPHVWLSFTFNEVASLRYYSFGSGESPVKVMGLSLLKKQARDFIICREGTELINGVCQQKCHSECNGCRTSGSNSPTDCIACKHLKVSYPYREGQTGDFECVAQCPQHMKSDTATKTCSCIKRMEETRPNGVVDCVTECPLTHFDDNNVCKKCSSFCKDVSNEGKRTCSGPASTDCDTCKYQHEGSCVEGCRPGQKAVKGCTDPLGMESGAIPDDSITASTFWGVGYEPYRGRLNGVAGNGAWAVTTSTIGEWLQVDLGEKKPVTGTIIQGRYYYDQWVTSYKLQYSVDGRSWIKYASSVGSEKVFPGNTDRNTPVTNLLDRPIDARYVRFLPQSWHGYIRMRVEVLGCTFKADNNNTFTCHRCQPGHACKLGDEQEDICPAGKVSNDNRTMCVPCAAGEFSSAPGAEACQKCPAGKYSTGGGSTSCLDCPAGKYSEAVGSTGCKVCPAGQYSSTAGSDGCTDCPAGQYSSTAGSDGCTDCSAGQYSSTAGSDGCTNCPAGQYSSTAGSDGCTNCPAGQYSSTAGSDGCTDCPAGQYSDAAESTGCKVCPVGKFSDAARSTGCKDCPAGQYSSRVGSNRCAYCPAGQYSSSGSNGCTDCPVGRYSNARGSMTCTNCRAGYYNAATRSTSCTACPPRTYSSREGLTHCSDCHYGSTTTGYGKSSCTDCFSSFQHFPRTDCGRHGEYDIAAYHGVTARICAKKCCQMKACLSFQHNSNNNCSLKNKRCSSGEKSYASNGNMYDRPTS